MSTTINGDNITVPGTATITALIRPIVTAAVNYAILATDDVVVITVTGVRVTLPTAVGVAGKRYTVKLTAAYGFISPQPGQTIDAASEYQFSEQYQHATLVSNGANWLIIEGWLPTPGYTNLY